jgi:palmitoyl-protein thioesterase
LLLFLFAVSLLLQYNSMLISANINLHNTRLLHYDATLPLVSLPLVVLHGVASSSSKMDVFCKWLEISFNRNVYNIEIGNGEQNSIYMPLSNQLDILCNTIYTMDELKYGFDFIGMSQGGLLARGYVEKCNKYPVSKLFNMVSPNGGVIEDIDVDMYSTFYQEHFSISGYWRDPLNIDTYLLKCQYLPIYNNERETIQSVKYRENIMSLSNYIVIWSPFDDVIVPPESAKFSFLDKDYNIIPLEKTTLYIDDLLGLRKLTENNKFNIYNTSCSHVEHRDPVCFDQLHTIFKEYL